jgi:hypothetical protein
MVATPTPERPAYGFITNGSEFIFLKLLMQPTPQYTFSDLLTLRRRQNELYQVVSILKKLSGLINN